MITKEELQKMIIEMDEEVAKAKKRYLEYNYYKNDAYQSFSDLMKLTCEIARYEAKLELLRQMMMGI